MELLFSQYQHQSRPVPSIDKVCSALRYSLRNIDPVGRRHEYMEPFHMRCQRQILDVCWWVHVSNAEVLQRSGLSTIDDILRHRRLSLHVWPCCTSGHDRHTWDVWGVPAHDALRLTVAIRRQKGSSQLEKTAGSPLQRLAQQAVRVATQYVSALSSPVGAQGPYAADPSRRNVSTCSFPRRTRSHAHRCSRLTL